MTTSSKTNKVEEAKKKFMFSIIDMLCNDNYINGISASEIGLKVIELSKPYIETVISQAKEAGREEEKKKSIKMLKRLKLEFDVCICQCGEKWSETDGADLVKEFLQELQSK